MVLKRRVFIPRTGYYHFENSLVKDMQQCILKSSLTLANFFLGGGGAYPASKTAETPLSFRKALTVASCPKSSKAFDSTTPRPKLFCV